MPEVLQAAKGVCVAYLALPRSPRYISGYSTAHPKWDYNFTLAQLCIFPHYNFPLSLQLLLTAPPGTDLSSTQKHVSPLWQ